MRILILLFCVLTTFVYSGPPPLKPLTINIVGYNNGVGLSQDIQILEHFLTDLGHEVYFVDVRKKKKQDIQHVDINIFVEATNSFFCPYAKKNYLLPNPEWLQLSPKDVATYDGILCKTRETERIFKLLNPNTFFLGFTCFDRYNPQIAKNYDAPLHLVGASIQKGTETLLDAWKGRPDFPILQLLRHKGKAAIPQRSNIHLVDDYLSKEELITFQNHCGIHLCPSITEGFGYYIVEGLSVEAVVITTDGPPMNEFVLDPRCLVKCSHTEPWRKPYFYATGYYVDQKDLEKVVTHLLSLPTEELQEIGRKNRELFLQKTAEFKENLKIIFNREYVFKSGY